MEKNSLFKSDTIEKIKKLRKMILWVAVWILIGELIAGAILILLQNWNVSIGKIQGSFLMIAIALFASVNNFVRMEKGNRTIQICALISFVSNIMWLIFGLLLMWEILPATWIEEKVRSSGYYGRGSYTTSVYHLTIWSVIALVTVNFAMTGFFASNILSIKETIKVVKPLKITAIVCLGYLCIFCLIETIMQPEYEDVTRLTQLFGLASLAFVVTSIAALIISRTNKNKTHNEEQINNVVAKSENELRAEIEEKVRKEMMEKEIHDRVEKEMQDKIGEKVQGGEAPTENVEESTEIIEETFKTE